MHPHRDDEILTYLRSGKVKHIDSVGYTNIISNQHLMMMNAEAQFSHEELSLEEGGLLEGLQIFVRPEMGGLEPEVQFYRLPEIYSLNQWRKIAGKGKDYPLEIRSNTWLMDIRLEKGKEISLPEAPADNTAFLFYVFNGDIQVKEDMLLAKGESVLIENEKPQFHALETSDVVLFITQTSAAHFDGGMYSGNFH
jgi:quercetin 2,3-dioxygenase